MSSKTGFKNAIDCELAASKANKRFYAFTKTNGGLCQISDKCKPTKTSTAWQIYEICAPAPAPKPEYPAPSPVEAVILDDAAQKKNPWAIHCNHEEHCIIRSAKRCQKVTKKLKIADTVQEITNWKTVGGCYRENGKTFFNKALVSNRNLAVKGKQFVVCEECKWVNPAPKAPAPAPKTRETTAATTPAKRDEAPIAVSSTQKTCKVHLSIQTCIIKIIKISRVINFRRTWRARLTTSLTVRQQDKV